MQLIVVVIISFAMVSFDIGDIDYSCAVQSQPMAPSAMVRIVSKVATGNTTRVNTGSGTLIDWHGDKYVLTASHIFRDGIGTTTITTQNRETITGTIVLQDVNCDIVVLQPSRELNIVPLKVANTEARKGDKTTAWGFGGNGQLLGTRGELLSYSYSQKTGGYETLRTSGKARYGDSGGAILNAKNELIAVIWGTDGQSTYGTCHLRLQKILTKLREPVTMLPIPPPKLVPLQPEQQRLPQPPPIELKEPDAQIDAQRFPLIECISIALPSSLLAYCGIALWYRRRQKKRLTAKTQASTKTQAGKRLTAKTQASPRKRLTAKTQASAKFSGESLKQTINDSYAQELNRLFELSGHSLSSDAILGRLYDQRLRAMEESANSDIAKFARQLRKQVGDQFLRIHSPNPSPAE